MSTATILPARATGPAGSSRDRSLFDRPFVLAVLVILGLYGLYAPAAFLDVVRTLRLPDTDDAMRLVEVRDLIHGQAWYDLVQHRHGPPLGVSSHWSRFVDLPIAGLILLLVPLVGERLAEGWAAALWPPIVFTLYAVCLFHTVRHRFGLRPACLALFVAGQTAVIAALFAPGRIDHHNVQVLAAVLVGLCLMRPERPVRAGLAAGAVSAFSLAVGLEALPFVAAAGLFVAADWVRAGPAALGMFRAFGLSLAGMAAALFALQTSPSLWAATACDALSPPWLWLAATGAAAGLAAGIAGPRLPRPAGRGLLLAAVGLVGGAIFLRLFPACAGSPFAGLPEIVRTQWLDQVNEARSFADSVRATPAGTLGFCVPFLVAALAATALALRGAAAHRRYFAVAAAFLWPGVLVTAAQIRGVYVCAGFLPLVAGVVFDRALLSLREGGASRWSKVGLFVLTFALVGKTWVVAVEVPRRLLAPHAVAAEDAADAAQAACSAPATLAALDALPPGLVLAPIDLGPSLLLHTHHAVVAAPYHRGVDGLTAGLTAFGGDEGAARAASRTSRARYLVACSGRAEPSLDDRTPFATDLARGKVEVPWLTPVAVPTTDLKVWRIAPDPKG